MIDKDSDLMLRALPLTYIVNTLTFGIPSLLARRQTRGVSDRMLSRFALMPLSQMILMAGFNISYFYSGKPFGLKDTAVIIIMVAACIAVDIIFYRTMKAVVRIQDLETRLDLQSRHYAALVEQQRGIRILRHDIANHLMAARTLAQEDNQRAYRYLDGLDETLTRLSATDFCENQIASAVLWEKSAEAAAQGIDFDVAVSLPEEIGIEEHDLISLLSNLLDNALAAAAKAEEKSVSVSLRREKGMILLQVDNTFSQGAQPNFKSTQKQDRSRHGLGITIVQDICRKYNGSLRFSEKETMVHADVLLIELNTPAEVGHLDR